LCFVEFQLNSRSQWVSSLRTIKTKLNGGNRKKGFSFEMITFLANNLPTGKKRACFWRPVERCVILLIPV